MTASPGYPLSVSGVFRGFRHQSVFKLSDGSFWLQVDDQTLPQHAVDPAATILERDDGRFLQVAGIDVRVRVHPLTGVIESHIKGRFTGWTGKSTYQLSNGQTWQQAKFLTRYVVKYRPEVLIYAGPSGPIMQVAGTSVNVRQIG